MKATKLPTHHQVITTLSPDDPTPPKTFISREKLAQSMTAANTITTLNFPAGTNTLAQFLVLLGNILPIFRAWHTHLY